MRALPHLRPPSVTRRRCSACVCLLAVLALLTVSSGETLAATTPTNDRDNFLVIVHPRNPHSTLEQRFVADALLKKITTWPDGEPIRPVDLDRDSATRREFTERVLNRSPLGVRSYWQQIIFAGRGVPPPEQASDDAVVRFVLRYPGALGYVSAGTDLHGAKPVSIRY